MEMPDAPGAIKTMMEQNVLFAVLAVVIVVLATFSYNILTRYLKKLESESDQTKVLEEIRKELNALSNEVREVKGKVK